MLKEKFQILPKKKEVILEYMPILKRVIEEEGGKWIGCYRTYLGEGEYDEWELMFEFQNLEWLSNLFIKLEQMPESQKWINNTTNRSNKILVLKYR